MDEGQVTAYWEAVALEYDAQANPGVVAEALLAIADATPDLYRGAVEAAAKAVGRRYCTHGNADPQPLPDISDLTARRTAAQEHAGLCGHHHAQHIACIDLCAADERARGAATTTKNLRNQVSLVLVLAWHRLKLHCLASIVEVLCDRMLSCCWT